MKLINVILALIQAVSGLLVIQHTGDKYLLARPSARCGGGGRVGGWLAQSHQRRTRGGLLILGPEFEPHLGCRVLKENKKNAGVGEREVAQAVLLAL